MPLAVGCGPLLDMLLGLILDLVEVVLLCKFKDHWLVNRAWSRAYLHGDIQALVNHSVRAFSDFLADKVPVANKEAVHRSHDSHMVAVFRREFKQALKLAVLVLFELILVGVWIKRIHYLYNIKVLYII